MHSHDIKIGDDAYVYSDTFGVCKFILVEKNDDELQFKDSDGYIIKVANNESCAWFNNEDSALIYYFKNERKKVSTIIDSIKNMLTRDINKLEEQHSRDSNVFHSECLQTYIDIAEKRLTRYNKKLKRLDERFSYLIYIYPEEFI